MPDEGVIKFNLQHKVAPIPPGLNISVLEKARKELFGAGLIGQDPRRYGGFGYGNISGRLSYLAGTDDCLETAADILPDGYELTRDDSNAHKTMVTPPFLVTGSQTGHKPELQYDDYVLVTDYLPLADKLISQGQIKPSSESSTHALIYRLANQVILSSAAHFTVNAVIHVHSSELWHQGQKSGLPETSPEAPYGSRKLQQEIENLWISKAFENTPILIMRGHQDGIIAFGNTMEEAKTVLLDYWQRCR